MMPIDYSLYPENWKSEIVPRILSRAKNKCECCGLPNYSFVHSVKLYLKVKETGRWGFRSIWFRARRDALKIEHLAESIKKIKVVVTVAHLDHDEKNPEVKDDRLKALCQYCHLKYDAKDRYRRQVEKGNNNLTEGREWKR